MINGVNYDAALRKALTRLSLFETLTRTKQKGSQVKCKYRTKFLKTMKHNVVWLGLDFVLIIYNTCDD